MNIQHKVAILIYVRFSLIQWSYTMLMLYYAFRGVGPVCLQINCQQYHLPTSHLPIVRLRTKCFAYSSIAYKLYFAQLKNSKTEICLHTLHYCTQVALHTWYYCLQIDCQHVILCIIQKLRQAGTFAHTN